MPASRSAIAVSLAVVAIIVLVAYRNTYQSRQGFAADPAPEVYRTARELFGGEKPVTYSDYKAAVPGADPVQFADIRKLWLSGRLTVDSVRGVL